MYIYLLTFADGSKYIGKTTRSLDSRFKEHLAMMYKGTHHSKKVQDAYRNNGAPTISSLEEVSIEYADSLDEREKFWIKNLDTYNNGLNLTIGGEGTGYGEDAPNSKYSLEDYCAVVSFLAETGMSGCEISEELDIPYSIVNNINSGYTHQYLSSIMPDLYIKMLAKKGTRSKQIHSNDTYTSIIKDLAYTTDTYKVIAERYSVNISIVSGISYCKKYPRLYKDNPIEFRILQDKNLSRARSTSGQSIVSPDGTLYPVINARQFCIAHNLETGAISRVLNNKQKTHKGWKLAS